MSRDQFFGEKKDIIADAQDQLPLGIMFVDSEADSTEMDYSDINDQELSEDDSDVETQRAFSRGDLKPGLNVLSQKIIKDYKNDIGGLKQKLSEFHLPLPWIERLDLTLPPAPLAPELDVELVEHGQRRERQMKGRNKDFSLEDDPVHNDFKREMLFYRQAQAAAMAGLQRLDELGLPGLRPDDYFAQMAKSDEHMQKVRRRLIQKQIGQQISERVRKIREIKKFGKKVQVEVEQRKHKEKREMLEKIKKFRKGKTDTIDFLEDHQGPLRERTTNGTTSKTTKQKKNKRTMKDRKFGFGGRKRNAKRNTARSHAQSHSLPASTKHGVLKNKNRNRKNKGSKRKGGSKFRTRK